MQLAITMQLACDLMPHPLLKQRTATCTRNTAFGADWGANSPFNPPKTAFSSFEPYPTALRTEQADR
jgi:hypothetical protein